MDSLIIELFKEEFVYKTILDNYPTDIQLLFLAAFKIVAGW